MRGNSYIPRIRPDVDLEFQRDVRQLFEKLSRLSDEFQAQLNEVRTLAQTYDFGYIRNQLQANGSAQLNVQGLLGQLSQPQLAMATIVPTTGALGTNLPPNGHPLRQDGSLVVSKTTVPTYGLYVFDAAVNNWVAL